MSSNLKCNVKDVDETSSLHVKNWTKTAMVRKKKQVGDDNMFTSARFTTLFVEATRMSQPWCSSFSLKLLGCLSLGVPPFHRSY